jgi:hypothetical protein
MSFYDVLVKLHEFIRLKLKFYGGVTVKNDFCKRQNYFIENKHKITITSFVICLLIQNVSFFVNFNVSPLSSARIGPCRSGSYYCSPGLILLSGTLQSLSEQVDWLPYVIPVSLNASVK